MSVTSPEPAGLFAITGQEQLTRFDVQLGNVTYWRIYFRTHSGVDAWLEVDDNAYSARTVAHLVQEKAREIEQVQRLPE